MATKKMKRYDEGGVTDDMRAAAETEGAKDDGPDSTSVSGSAPSAPEAKSSPSSFKAAFAAARSNGDKTFTYNGKLYTTQLAGSSAPKTAKSSNYSNEGRRSTPTVVTPRARSLVDQGRNVDLYGGTINDIKNMFGKSKVRAGSETKMAKGGVTSSASSRGDGIAQRGKTKGTMVMCSGGMAKK